MVQPKYFLTGKCISFTPLQIRIIVQEIEKESLDSIEQLTGE